MHVRRTYPRRSHPSLQYRPLPFLALGNLDLEFDSIESIDGPISTLMAQKVDTSPKQTLRELAGKVHGNQWDLMKHSQWRLKNMLESGARPPLVFNTMVNILIVDKSEGDEISERLFKRFGERRIWETEYTSVDLLEEDGKLVLAVTTKLEEDVARDLATRMITAVRMILEEPDTLLETVL